MSQRWVTLNQPPRKTDVENYTNSDQNIVWQELLRRNQLKSARQSERFLLPKCNPDRTGLNRMHNTEDRHCVSGIFGGRAATASLL